MIDSIIPTLQTGGSDNLIRDAVSLIIFQELVSQRAKVSESDALAFLDSFFEGASPRIYQERLVAFDQSELNAINIYVQQSNGDESGSRKHNRTVTINIDVITKAKSNSSDNGSSLASISALKMVSCLKDILHADIYSNLGFGRTGFITHAPKVGLSAARNPEEDENNASYNGAAALSLSVGYCETRLTNGYEALQENYTLITADGGRFSVQTNTD